jgi:hypothetical protein
VEIAPGSGTSYFGANFTEYVAKWIVPEERVLYPEAHNNEFKKTKKNVKKWWMSPGRASELTSTSQLRS